jgi:hypothetical protein
MAPLFRNTLWGLYLALVGPLPFMAPPELRLALSLALALGMALLARSGSGVMALALALHGVDQRRPAEEWTAWADRMAEQAGQPREGTGGWRPEAI